jgi:hypothetical protein
MLLIKTGIKSEKIKLFFENCVPVILFIVCKIPEGDKEM